MRVETSLGISAPKIAGGCRMFRFTIETDEKHPWSEEKLWHYETSGPTQIEVFAEDAETLILGVYGLPVSESWGIIVVPGSRWCLDVIVYPELIYGADEVSGKVEP